MRKAKKVLSTPVGELVSPYAKKAGKRIARACRKAFYNTVPLPRISKAELKQNLGVLKKAGIPLERIGGGKRSTAFLMNMVLTPRFVVRELRKSGLSRQEIIAEFEKLGKKAEALKVLRTKK